MTATAIDYFRFTLTEAKEVGLALRQLDADAHFTVEDGAGNVLHSGTEADANNLWVSDSSGGDVLRPRGSAGGGR